ncbi:sec1 family domain-containing protein 1-like [Littorina saxatilis]|uniref:Sec1 family domain-containing protein 1 n=1 Tax=Littorina saxatilis TaxID=31220 RepID=A0AAN9B583_9CAEN
MASNLREKQTAALKRMLNFNAPQTKANVAEPQWKILVYDRFGQDIISPLLTVKELRDLGVTLHLNLHTDRDPIPDVPAIYFVLPTDDNIQRICRDFQNGLYESYYLNFISAISRQKLEDIASAAVQSGTVQQVSKVVDQYLNFISLEDDLFCLRHQDREPISYYAINRGDVKDSEMEATMDIIVDSLFSVFVTLGTVPIIRCPRGNAAEMVAEKLDKKLRENLRDSRNSQFASEAAPGQFSFQRPMLVLLDRNIDLATMMHHTWTYQALIHDVLDYRLNRVEIEEVLDEAAHSPSRKPRTKKKAYDMGHRDQFWLTQKGSPFPTVAEAVQEALDAYRVEEDEVKKLKSAMGLEGTEDDAAIGMLSDTTARLTSAVSSLPELLEKKRLIDMHTNIATALLDHIKHRKLDNYFEMEERMMSKSTLSQSLMDIITDPEAGTPEDKARLFIIALICGPPMSEAEIDQYCTTLQASNCDLAAVQYVRRWKSYSKITATPSMYTGGGVSSTGMFSNLLSKGSSFVMEGVKNLVVKRHNLPTTRIIDALMEQKSVQEVDDFRYFDPKLLRAESGNVPRSRAPFQEAFVFVVGGGNYIEYQNLMDYARSRAPVSPKKIVYGCSDLVNATQFLRQLSQLGTEM